MSDKRFKKGYNLSCRDTETGKSYYYACNLSGLLNRYQTTIQELQEENEQLKKEYKIAIDEMVTDYKKLEEENEQLREALKNSYNWEICENCEYANYSSHYVYAEGIEYDFECLKGHAHVDEMSECDEFKLKIR